MSSSQRKALRLLYGFIGVLVVWVAGAIGYAIGDSGGEEAPPAGNVQGAISNAHQGENLPVASIGDPKKGEQVFTATGCSSCHSYAGKGGSDAPALDFMKGHLSASEIADMSGVIWNHVPAMIPHFKEEGIPFPTFKGSQMADLIAYLHGGAPGGKATSPAAGGQQTSGGGESGEELFTSSCGSCHTLAAAGTRGTVGPNLDDLRPSEQVALNAIQTGPGAMPPGLYSGAEAEAVAKFVAQNAGK